MTIDWLAFVGADNIALPDALSINEKSSEYDRVNPQIVLVYSFIAITEVAVGVVLDVGVG